MEFADSSMRIMLDSLKALTNEIQVLRAVSRREAVGYIEDFLDVFDPCLPLVRDAGLIDELDELLMLRIFWYLDLMHGIGLLKLRASESDSPMWEYLGNLAAAAVETLARPQAEKVKFLTQRSHDEHDV